MKRVLVLLLLLGLLRQSSASTVFGPPNVDVLTGHLEAPTAKTYVLDQSAAFPYTINSIVIQTLSGTATVAVKIGSTSVTSLSAVSVSSTPTTATASGANQVAVGNQVILVVSSISTPVDMTFTIKYSR